MTSRKKLNLRYLGKISLGHLFITRDYLSYTVDILQVLVSPDLFLALLGPVGRLRLWELSLLLVRVA